MPLFSRPILSRADQQMIQQAIANAESQSGGEVRVSIRERRSRKEKDLSVEDLAQIEFHTLGMEETVGRTGVLIYLLLSDRTLRIVADEGIHQHVDDTVWQEIADRITAQFRYGSYRDGLIEGVVEVGKILAKYIPRASDDKNELPDEVVIR
jgi:uncharacterized membrane protein